MESRANNALIGLFTLLVIGFAFAFVYWFARAADATTAAPYRVVFSGAVTGLSVGSNVLFNGIRVGGVDDLQVAPDDPSKVIATISVREGTPIKADTRARLEFQGLTGGASIQLSGGSRDAAELVETSPGVMPTIAAERSELQNLLDTVRDVSGTASSTFARIDTILRDNDDDIRAIVTNARSFSEALGENSGNISAFLQSTGDAARALSSVSASVAATSDDLRDVIAALDPQQINRTLANVEQASADLATLARTIDSARINTSLANVEAFTNTLAATQAPLQSFANDAAALTSRLNAMAPQLEATLEGLSNATKGIDPERVARTLESIDTFTATLGRNAGEVEAIVRDARTAASALAASAPRLETTMAAIEKTATAIDGEAIGRAVAAIENAASGLDGAKIASAVDNFERFSASLGANAGEIEAMIRDARALAATLNDAAPKIDSTLTDLERLTTALDGERIGRTVENIDRFSTALGDNAASVDRFLKDAASIGEKLNATADRLDTVLANVDAMVGGAGDSGLFTEIGETARAIRVLANNLDARTATLTRSIEQFTGPGLRDYQKLATDGQRTLQSIERALRSFERNPSQVIFGPRAKVPEFAPQ